MEWTEIKSLRQRHKLTQQELSNRVGVGWATLNRWENGKVKISNLGRRALEHVKNELELNRKGARGEKRDKSIWLPVSK